jgi:hypothetical protein
VALMHGRRVFVLVARGSSSSLMVNHPSCTPDADSRIESIAPAPIGLTRPAGEKDSMQATETKRSAADQTRPGTAKGTVGLRLASDRLHSNREFLLLNSTDADRPSHGG